KATDQKSVSLGQGRSAAASLSCLKGELCQRTDGLLEIPWQRPAPTLRCFDLTFKPSLEKATIESRALGRDLVGLAGDLSRDTQQHRAAGDRIATGMQVQLRKDLRDLLRLPEIARQKPILALPVHRL